jgi:hypothetical protein
VSHSVRLVLAVGALITAPIASRGILPAQSAPVPGMSTRPATDSVLVRRASAAYFSVIGTLHASEVRSTLVTSTPLPQRRVALKGVDVILHPRAGGIGLWGRMGIAETPSAGKQDLGNLEVGVGLGGVPFAVELGYVRRNGYSITTGYAHDSTHAFLRAGVRMRGVLGNTGFALSFRGGVYGGDPREDDVETAAGWEGETAITYIAPVVPFSMRIGYRIERFLVAGFEQEVSSLVIGSGITFGGRR